MAEIHGEQLKSYTDISRFSNVAILAPRNDHCKDINARVLNLIPGKSTICSSVNTLVVEDESELLQFPSEFLESSEMRDLPPHTLELKKGCIAMLLGKLNVTRRLLNGTRLIVTKMFDNCLQLTVITGAKARTQVLLPRM